MNTMTRVGILLLSLSVAFCALPLSTFVSAEEPPASGGGEAGDPGSTSPSAITITPSAMGAMVISLPEEDQSFEDFMGEKIENNLVDTYVSSEITVSNTTSSAPDYAKNSFLAGYTYKVSVHVTPQSGYQFSGTDSSELLGVFTYSNDPMSGLSYIDETIEGSVEPTGFTVSANVTMPGVITPRAISNSAVNISISSLPAAGTKVSDFIATYSSTDADNHYSYAMKVMTEEGVEVPGTESFEATNKYKFEIKATAENGYKFYDAIKPEPAMFFRSVSWATGYEFRDGGSPAEHPQVDFDTSDYKWFSVYAFNKENLPSSGTTEEPPATEAVKPQNFTLSMIGEDKYSLKTKGSLKPPGEAENWIYFYFEEASADSTAKYDAAKAKLFDMINSASYPIGANVTTFKDIIASSTKIEINQSNLSVPNIDLTGKNVAGIFIGKIYTLNGDKYMMLSVGGSTLPTSVNDPKGDEIKGDGTPEEEHVHTFETAWTYDAQIHWHKATCGHSVTDGEATHIWNGWVIVEQPGVGKEGKKENRCNVCDYTIEEIIPATDDPTHVHTFEETWSFDPLNHWQRATCGHNVTQGNAPHNYGNWTLVTAPTATTTGLQERYCTVCNYRNLVTIPATGNNNNNNSNNNNTNTPTTNSIINSLNNAAGTGLVTVSYEGNPILQASVFDALRNTYKTLELTSQNGATWIFNGADINNVSKNIDLNVSVGYHDSGLVGTLPALITSLVNNTRIMTVTFANNGVLPGRATIRLPLTSDIISYMGPSGLYVYYVNEQTRLLELIASNLNIMDGNKIEFAVTHNSTFIITKGPAPTSSVATTNNNITNVNPLNSIDSTLKNPNEITMIPSVPWNETFIAQNENNNSQQPQNANGNDNQAPPATLTDSTSQPSAPSGSTTGTTATRAPRTDDSMMMYFWLIAMITGICLLAFALLYLGRYTSYGSKAVNQRQQDIRTYRQAERYLEKFFA